MQLPRVMGFVLAAGLSALAVTFALNWLNAGHDQAGLTAAAPAGVSGAVQESGTAAVGGPFTLTGTDGAPVASTDFAGKPLVIYFGYTTCPDVCPISLNRVSAALDAMGDAAKAVQPIFITVDPERDRPDAIAEYLSHFHPGFVGLTGAQNEIDTVLKAYRVYAARVERPDSAIGYLMDHSDIIYVLDGDHAFEAFFAPNVGPHEMADRLKKIAAAS